MHPNPHVSTIIGIIAAARETKAPVDIYLTNPLSPWVIKSVGDFLETNGINLRIARIRLMAKTANSGTLALYGNDRNDTDSNWELYDPSGKEMWSTFPDELKKQSKEISSLVIPYPVAPPPRPPPRKRRRISFENELVIPSHSSIRRPVLPREAILPAIKRNPQSHEGLGFGLPAQAPVFVRSPWPERTVSSMLLGTTRKVDHGRLTIFTVRYVHFLSEPYLT
jgi:hypothetical protein